MKKQKAFTLVEILIASLIFTVVMVSIYAAFHSGIFGYRSINESIDTYQAARAILERLNTDLRNSFAYSSENTKFTGAEKEMAFLALVDSYPEFASVSYKSEGGKLMRLCKKNQEALKENSEIKPKELAGNLEIGFEYGYLPEGQQEIKFNDCWPIELNETNKLLPQAVRVSLTIKGKIEQSFERTIYLTLAE